jgi:RHS repeat-associated protein
MSIHSHLPYDQSISHARIPAGGINLIASIDSVSEAQGTVSFFGSTKALHGENAIPSAETTTHNHSNQQYSITAVTTSTGTIAERYAYSAYGEPTILDGSGSVISSSSINNRYSYTGREWDVTAGLYHFRARWMSPKTGRFLGRDPIEYEGSEWGLYEFVDGNSLSALDPKGLSIFNPHPSVTRTIPYACIAPNWSNHFVAAGTCTCTFPPPNNSPLGGFFQTAAFATCTEKACVASIYSVCGQFYASLMQPNEMGIKTQACLRARFGAAVTCECT